MAKETKVHRQASGDFVVGDCRSGIEVGGERSQLEVSSVADRFLIGSGSANE